MIRNIMSFMSFWLLAMPVVSTAQQPDPNTGLFYIAQKQQIIIDADLGEWQNQIPVYLNQRYQTRYRKGEWRGPTDLSAKFWIGWNDDGLAIAAEVVDDSVAFPFSGHDVWANDCIQFAVDVQDDNAPNFYQNDDREFVVTFADSDTVVYEYSYSEQRPSGRRDFPVKIAVSSDTIRYEVLIPWEEGLGIIGPLPGMHMGISVVFFDNDGDNYRGWIQWTAGITQKKFTLPFATVLLFDPEINFVQSIPTKTFLSKDDTVYFWLYSRYYRKNVTFMLLDKNETLYRNNTSLRSRSWIKVAIPPKYLIVGNLSLQIASVRISQRFDIAVWSKQLITEQIGYLTQQFQVFKNLKDIDPAAGFTVDYWIEYLKEKFAQAVTDFDFYNVMIEAQKRIDQIPNFYLNKQIFYNWENRIVEKFYRSRLDSSRRRYLVHLPADYSSQQKYPLLVFFHNDRNSEEESARKIGSILMERELPVVGLFPAGYPELGITYFGLNELMQCLNDMQQKYAIDRSRIYLAGEGSGGVEALLLAKRNPDQFAAVTTFFSELGDQFEWSNLHLFPLWLFDDNPYSKYSSFIQQTKQMGGDVNYTVVDEISNQIYGELMSDHYFQWLLNQRLNDQPPKIQFETRNLIPAKVFWAEIFSLKDYAYPAYFRANIDSNRLEVHTKNISEFALIKNRLPAETRFPLEVVFDNRQRFKINAPELEAICFLRSNSKWKIHKPEREVLQKTSLVNGGMASIFDKPLTFVYSTQHPNLEYNEMTFRLAKAAARRGRQFFLKNSIIADTSMVKQKINSNIITFGNASSNVYLRKIISQLPMRFYEKGLKFGDSYCDVGRCAALYIYPNPQQTDFLIMCGIADDTVALKNIGKIWDLSATNRIYFYDYVIFADGVERNNYRSWIEFGSFDHEWSLPWFQPPFRTKPKYWTNDIVLGLDANQLLLNKHWKGGGKSNFTWKIYSRMEFNYERKKINWKNSLYLAFGQISVEEDEKWRSPEKSTDIINFDSVLKLRLKKFIDPYIAFSLDTQFHEGFNPKTKQLISRFANPLQISQSAGIARNISDAKKLQLTTRVGCSIKEVIATDSRFRNLWTGDEAKWMKTDGGIEWLTESKSVFKNGIMLTNRLKLFQAVISSISPKKDPNKNWKALDVYFEQMFSAKLSQYFVFNVVIKIIYDRDTSPGWQLWESTSFGLTYKF